MRERRFPATERELADVITSASDAIVSGSLDGTIRTWNKGAERLYGYTEEEMLGHSFLRLVRRQDLPRSKVLHANVKEGGPPVPEIDTRAIRKDGTSVAVSLSISPLVNDAGELVGAVVIARDITRRKAIESNRREAVERFTGAFDSAPIGMALVSVDGRFLEVNPSLCLFLGRSAEELTDLTFQELTHPDDLEQDLDMLGDLVAGRIPRYELEKRYLRPDGAAVWGRLCVSLVRTDEGEPHHFVSQILDINAIKQQDLELRRLAGHLRDLSLHDPLTGLGNPRAFDRELDDALLRVSEGGTLALVLIDLDDLKAHNLAHGRLSGDHELIEVARAIESAAGGAGVAYRIGGDEFAVLLADAAPELGAAAAERIAGAIAASPAHVRAAVAPVSAPVDGCSRDALLDHADLSLRDAEAGCDPLPLPAMPPEVSSPGSSELILDSVTARLGLDAACYCEGENEVIRVACGDTALFGLRAGEPLSAAAVAPVASVPLGDPAATVHLFARDGHEPIDERRRELVRFAGALVCESLTREAAEALQRTADLELSGVAALVAALEARDRYTAEHSRSVVDLAGAVARRLGLDQATVATVERVAVLHDVGKVAVPDAILQKKGPLTPAEWELMHQHPAVGERIVASTRTLAHLAAPIRAEHERWDGGGYPDGLRGEKIPIASRVTFACDAYHAMTSHRPYRAAMSEDAAHAELRAHAGSQFDPAVVGALLEELAETPRKIAS